MTVFIAQQIVRSHTIRLPAVPQEVFPLFSPLGEKHWVHGWEPEILYPASGQTQPGMVFTTRQANGTQRIWTIVAYASEETRVSYVNVLPDWQLSRIDVSCEADGAQETLATITYTLTGLTPQGNTALHTFTQVYFEDYISTWQTAITDYLLANH